MPNDNSYKYALVVIDVGSRLCDAVPLKTKSNIEIIQAFNIIYSRKNGKLKFPKRLEVDAGTEFKGSVKRFFDTAQPLPKTICPTCKSRLINQRGKAIKVCSTTAHLCDCLHRAVEMADCVVFLWCVFCTFHLCSRSSTTSASNNNFAGCCKTIV